MTPSASRKAKVESALSVSASSSETSNVTGIGQIVPSARRIELQTPS